MSSHVSYEELREWSGYKTPSEVCAWLAKNEIPFLYGVRNRPITTAEAINKALGVLPSPANEEQKPTVEVG